MSHTPEPWAVGLGDDAGKYNLIAINDKDQTFVQIKPTLANAERVVACVNACAGIEDPSVVPELLAVLRAFVDYYDRHGGLENMTCPVMEYRAARLVLEKVVGQQ